MKFIFYGVVQNDIIITVNENPYWREAFNRYFFANVYMGDRWLCTKSIQPMFFSSTSQDIITEILKDYDILSMKGRAQMNGHSNFGFCFILGAWMICCFSWEQETNLLINVYTFSSSQFNILLMGYTVCSCLFINRKVDRSVKELCVLCC